MCGNVSWYDWYWIPVWATRSLSCEYYFTITQWLPRYWNVTGSWNNWSVLIFANASHRSLVIHLRFSIHHCLIRNNIWFHSTKTNLKPMSYIALTGASPYLVLTGELWRFSCEYFADFFARYRECNVCIVWDITYDIFIVSLYIYFVLIDCTLDILYWIEFWPKCRSPYHINLNVILHIVLYLPKVNVLTLIYVFIIN